MIITSRVRLRLAGEQVYGVPPLGLPPEEHPDAGTLDRHAATALFLERARAVRPDLRLDPEQAAAVAELCRRLDGMPLAIELAAARSRLFGPRQLLERLGRGLDLLGSGGRDRPSRHQTLRAAIAWSHELLEPRLKTVFRRLGVFSGGFELEALESVLAVEPACDVDSLAALEELVDQSLVRSLQGVEPRFGLLETISEFAREQLAEFGEDELVRRTHARHFLELAERHGERLTGPQQLDSLETLERDHDNLAAALGWSVAHEHETALRLGAAIWRFCLARDHLREGRGWLERLVGLPLESGKRCVVARVLGGAATLASNMGDNRAALGHSQRALELWREIDDQPGVAAELNNLGWLHCELAQLDAAERVSREALQLNRKLGLERGSALALNNLGWAASYRGQVRHAREHFERSLEIRRRIGDQRGIVFGLTNLAWATYLQGDRETARDDLEEALESARSLGDPLLSAHALSMRGRVARHQGEPERARELLERGLAYWERVGNPSGAALAATSLGAVLTELGELERAERLLKERALERWSRLESDWGEAWTLLELARWEQAAGRPAAACRGALDSLRRVRAVGDNRAAVELLELAAELAAQAGDEAVIELLGAADAIRQQTGLARSQRAQRCCDRLREQVGAGRTEDARSKPADSALERLAGVFERLARGRST